MQRKVFSKKNKAIENIGKQTDNSSCLYRVLLYKKIDNSRLEVLNKNKLDGKNYRKNY